MSSKTLINLEKTRLSIFKINLETTLLNIWINRIRFVAGVISQQRPFFVAGEGRML